MLPPHRRTIELKAVGDIRSICRHIAKSSLQGSMSIIGELTNAINSLDQLTHPSTVQKSGRTRR